MKEQLKNLPNAITLGNLLCGLIGIERVFADDMLVAFLFILIAAVLDFFDGFTARLLKGDGEMGKQLDSLADLVTFGVLPGLFFYHYMMLYGYCFPTGFCTSRYAWITIPAAAAWRLARFNSSTTYSTDFVGVPTPIAGICLASIAVSLESIQGLNQGFLRTYVSDFYFLSMAPVFIGWLMVSEFPMLALKFKKGDPINRWKWIMIAVLAAVVLVFQRDAGMPVLIAYVFISILANFAISKKQNG